MLHFFQIVVLLCWIGCSLSMMISLKGSGKKSKKRLRSASGWVKIFQIFCIQSRYCSKHVTLFLCHCLHFLGLAMHGNKGFHDKKVKLDSIPGVLASNDTSLKDHQLIISMCKLHVALMCICVFGNN